MTQHLLQGRQEKGILWYQWRDALKAAATRVRSACCFFGKGLSATILSPHYA
jgi:hypothetical protein